MLGGHVVKTGLSPVLIDLARRGVITHFASNGAAVIHDYEVARWGGTSEDVEAGLANGTFGMAEETGREMNEAIRRGARARAAASASAWPRPWRRRGALTDTPSCRCCWRRAARHRLHRARRIGAEIIHQHPRGRRRRHRRDEHDGLPPAGGHLRGLEGGVVLNIGSAVIMPEVFLKALTVCRNVHDGAPRASSPRTST
jgi:hypothetical protein